MPIHDWLVTLAYMANVAVFVAPVGHTQQSAQ
jgi:hypothetical protein